MNLKSQLNRMTRSQSDVESEIENQINKSIEEALADAIASTYRKLTEDILQKAKNVQYEEVGNKKRISGHIPLYAIHFTAKLGDYIEILRAMKTDRIQDKFFKNHPDISMSYDIDTNSYRLSCRLSNATPHKMFGRRYYTILLTDIAISIFNGVVQKAADDEIEVSFSYIQDRWGSKTTIPRNGYSAPFIGESDGGNIMLHYSIIF